MLILYVLFHTLIYMYIIVVIFHMLLAIDVLYSIWSNRYEYYWWCILIVIIPCHNLCAQLYIGNVYHTHTCLCVYLLPDLLVYHMLVYGHCCHACCEVLCCCYAYTVRYIHHNVKVMWWVHCTVVIQSWFPQYDVIKMQTG
jgi:hypothetical protein